MSFSFCGSYKEKGNKYPVLNKRIQNERRWSTRNKPDDSVEDSR
jgi:hypothetical protein